MPLPPHSRYLFHLSIQTPLQELLLYRSCKFSITRNPPSIDPVLEIMFLHFHWTRMMDLHNYDQVAGFFVDLDIFV